MWLIAERVDNLVSDLKSMDPLIRGQATSEAITTGVASRLVLSNQYYENFNYSHHFKTLSNLEQRARHLMALLSLAGLKLH